MRAEQRRFLIVDQSLMGGVINLLLNGAIAWYTFRALEWVPMVGGSQNILGDVLGTFFLLPLLVSLIVTALVRRQVRSGKLAALSWDRASHPLYRRLPASSWWRSLQLAVACTVFLGVPLLVIMHAFGVHHLAYWDFVIIKGIYAGVLAAVVSPLVAYAALGDRQSVTATA